MATLAYWALSMVLLPWPKITVGCGTFLFSLTTTVGCLLFSAANCDCEVGDGLVVVADGAVLVGVVRAQLVDLRVESVNLALVALVGILEVVCAIAVAKLVVETYENAES